MFSANQLKTGEAVRIACRTESWQDQTSALAPGFVQANLVILPKDIADDFQHFCDRNPRPCPVLERTEPGHPEPVASAPGADLRTDLPRYRLWRHGALFGEPVSIRDHWRENLVGFLLGCSFTFEDVLLRHGIPVRHVELGSNVPMYRTSIPCEPAGKFSGPLVVSMRPLTPDDADRAAEITSRMPKAHGAPIQIGSPESIGIHDIASPDYGDPVPIRDNEIPVFWACGVTPQAALTNAAPDFAITHKPGHMFVTDLRHDDL